MLVDRESLWESRGGLGRSHFVLEARDVDTKAVQVDCVKEP